MTEIEGHVELIPVTPMLLVQQALAAGASLETLERMIALQERWEANEARKAFETAMAAAAAEMPIIQKNALVAFESPRAGSKTSYQHADLADVVSTVGPILGSHGLYHRFETLAEPGKPITVTCRITHKMGHSVTNALTAQHDTSGNKNSIQAMGSTITYLSRYTLMAILGLAASEDDDGRGHREHKEPQAGPDVMTRPTQPPAAPSEDATLSPDQIENLKARAILAAKGGSVKFDEFWSGITSLDERAPLKAWRGGLKKLMEDADNADQTRRS